MGGEGIRGRRSTFAQEIGSPAFAFRAAQEAVSPDVPVVFIFSVSQIRRLFYGLSIVFPGVRLESSFSYALRHSLAWLATCSTGTLRVWRALGRLFHERQRLYLWQARYRLPGICCTRTVIPVSYTHLTLPTKA